MSTRFLISIVVLAFPVSGFSQLKPSDDDLRDFARRWSQHSIVVRGSENPSGIPYAEKMAMLVGMLAAERHSLGKALFEQRLQARVGGGISDMQTLAELAATNDDFSRQVLAAERRGLSSVCEDLVATGNVDAVDARVLAERLEQAAKDRLDQMERHYKPQIDRLDASVRESLLSQFESSTVPQMNWGYVSEVGLAYEFPLSYVQSRLRRCELFLRKQADWLEAPTRVEPTESLSEAGVTLRRERFGH